MRRKSITKIGTYVVLAVLMLCMVSHAKATVQQLVPWFADSAVQGFDSRMMDPAVQHFDSPMRNSKVQRFESRMMSSPVSRFESRMTNSALQRFHSQMMYSPAQRVEGPIKPFRPLTFLFFPIHRLVQVSVRETETPPDFSPRRSVAPPQFISLRCGSFTEIKVGKSEILSEKEYALCSNSERGRTDSDGTNDINSKRF